MNSASKHKGCSVIFVNDQDQVLLFLRDNKPEIPYPNMWDILGGHVEEGETPEQCIRREMMEEIGLDLKDFSLFEIFEFDDRTEYTFWKKADLDIDHIQLNEGQCLGWFSAGEAAQLPLAHGSDRILKTFFDLEKHGSKKNRMVQEPQNENLERKVHELVKALQDCRKDADLLREKEKRLAGIIDRISIPTLVINEQHVVTHCNKAYENLKGIPADQMIGTRNQWKTFYSKPRPVMMDYLADNVPEEKILRDFGSRCRKSAVAEGGYEAELFFPDLGENGEWLFFTSAPLCDENGKITGAIETTQDITQRKQAEEALLNSEKRLGTLLHFVPYPLAVFNLEGNITYINRGFTRVFGWTLKELEGKKIPYVPPGYEEEHKLRARQLYEEKILYRHESKRLTKDGRILDVAIRATLFYEEENKPAGELVLFRDISKEKKMTRINEALLRISMALPNYQELEHLLDYINEEVKTLLDTEGCVTVLADEDKKDLFIPAVAWDKAATEQRIKEHRFSMDELISGKVIRTGEPVIISDMSQDRALHEERDQKLGYRTRNMLVVPLKSSERIIGTLCAINKKPGPFESADLDILNMLSGTVALSVETAKFSRELKNAYREVASLNRAKDKAINHLSHELKTPLAVALGTLKILARRLAEQRDRRWETSLAMIQRNLSRIVDIQYEVNDIMQGRSEQIQKPFALRFDQCADLMENLLNKEGGAPELAAKVKKRINDLFGSKQPVSKHIAVEPFIRDRLTVLRPQFAHRQVEILLNLEPVPDIFIPEEILRKVFDGLLRNAIENTPDEGKVKILLAKQGAGAVLKIRDYGIGIASEAQKRIFEGFFPTRDTMLYSTKKPFDFMAGGKGADLLRMKIFSEQYHFKIDMVSSRCRHIPKESSVCPGRIKLCKHCKQSEDCSQSGGTTFSVSFPPAP